MRTKHANRSSSPRKRLCEKSRESKTHRIVFSIAVSRLKLPVQLVSVSTKLRQMFYTQIERPTFHTASFARTTDGCPTKSPASRPGFSLQIRGSRLRRFVRNG